MQNNNYFVSTEAKINYISSKTDEKLYLIIIKLKKNYCERGAI